MLCYNLYCMGEGAYGYCAQHEDDTDICKAYSRYATVYYKFYTRHFDSVSSYVCFVH